MRSLAGSLGDGVLADAILIPPTHRYCPPILGWKGHVEKSKDTSNRRNIY